MLLEDEAGHPGTVSPMENVQVPPLAKPRLRGVLHQYAFFVAVALGAVLVLRAPGVAGTAAVSVYAAGICGLFGVRALYHRRTWSPRAACHGCAPTTR